MHNIITFNTILKIKVHSNYSSMKVEFIPLLFLSTQYTLNVYGYMYHSHRVLKQPYSIIYSISHKEISRIDYGVSKIIANHWYDELLIYQTKERNTTKLQKDIDLLYNNKKDDYLKMSEIMSYNYNIHYDKELNNEYLIWKPKLHQVSMDEKVTNSMLYPCFRQTMCLVCFQCVKNDIEIRDMILNPFWNGDSKYMKRHLKKILIHYFITYLKHKSITFSG